MIDVESGVKISIGIGIRIGIRIGINIGIYIRIRIRFLRTTAAGKSLASDPKRGMASTVITPTARGVRRKV